jgi:hypothetical protein
MHIRSENRRNNYSADVPLTGEAELVSVQVPQKCRLVVKSFGNYCGTLTAWGAVYWVFLQDGRLIYPYENILDQLGYGPSRQPIEDVIIPGGHRFSIMAVNPTAAIVKMGISLEYDLEFAEG